MMYFESDASGSSQVWRERFPAGKPEQLTFGPTDAEDLTISPDGKSLITSIGLSQRSVWLSENGRERQVSSEGDALLPAWGNGFPTSVFSPEGEKIYYLVHSGVQRGFGSGELWVSNVEDGSRELLLPGLPISSYDISSDGQRVVFAAFGADGKSQLWLARLDRRSAPTRLPPAEGLGPVFGCDGEVYFRAPEGKTWYLFELIVKSGDIRKFTADLAVNSPGISPDGEWIISTAPVEGRDNATQVEAFSKRGGQPIVIARFAI